MLWVVVIVAVVSGFFVVSSLGEKHNRRLEAATFYFMRAPGDDTYRYCFEVHFPTMTGKEERSDYDYKKELFYKVRRDDGPRWLKQLTDESFEVAYKELKEKLDKIEAGEKLPFENKDEIGEELATLREWEAIEPGSEIGAELEPAYQEYLHTRSS